MEVEAKFLVADEATLARLIETASLAGCDVEPGEARRDVDTFLDTPDRRLLAAGYYFRRRETGDGVRFTLKQLVAPSDGVLRREEIEAKNQLDSLVYQVEKMLSENREKLAGGDVAGLESAITEGRKAMEQGGIDNLRRATENLTKASHKLAEVMYQQTGANAGAGAGPGSQSGPAGGESGSSKDDVIDAEVVDEEKR